MEPVSGPFSETYRDQMNLRLSRLSLFVYSFAVPYYGTVNRGYEVRFESMEARYVLGLLSFLGLVSTFLTPYGRSHPLRIVSMVSYAIFGWFIYAFSRNDLAPDNAMTLLLFAFAITVAAKGRVDVYLAQATAAVGLLYLYCYTADPRFPMSSLALMLATIVIGLGVIGRSRACLEEHLRLTNLTLEERVHERTRELEASLKKIEAEAKERARAEGEALRASQAKSSFLMNMSHELRTPLNAVVGYTELVSEEVAVLGRYVLVEDLEKVEGSVNHLVTLIDQILDLSRVEADELNLEICSVPLSEVASEAADLVRGQKGAELVVEVGDHRVLADADRLRQVFVNLLANAKRFTPDGSITIRARREGDRVLIDVADTGVGIDPAVLPNVFERFTQGDVSTTRRFGGCGLGLAISRSLMERMAGHLGVELTLGEGTTFTLALSAG